jgi:hypothetical protein
MLVMWVDEEGKKTKASVIEPWSGYQEAAFNQEAQNSESNAVASDTR